MRRVTIPVILLFSLISTAQAGPRILSYQGSLLDSSGQPVPDGLYDMRFRIYRDETTTVHAWQEIDTALNVFNGSFSTLLGDQTNFTTQFSNDFSLWLEIAVDLNDNGAYEPDEVFDPRQRLAGTGWAIEADRLGGRSAGEFADEVHEHGWSELTGIPSGFADDVDDNTDTLAEISAGVGQTIRWNGSVWEPVQLPPITHGHSWTELSDVPSGFADNVDNNSDTLAELSPSVDQTIRWNGSAWEPVQLPPVVHSHSWTELSDVPAGFADDVDNDTLAELSPSPGQMVRWNGSAWVPVTLSIPDSSPEAVLQADPAVLWPGETTTTLSLDLSYDPAGDPLTYAFAPMGRMVGEPTLFGGAPSTTAVYSSGGDYLAAGWVKDSGGNLARAQTLISVFSFFRSTVADANTNAFSSLAIVDGRPAIAYRQHPDFLNPRLAYVRADGDLLGRSWSNPVTVDELSVNMGTYVSLAVVNDRPAISYQDFSNRNLRYARANDATGASWSGGTTIDNATDTGYATSLVVVDGNPAIAYIDWGTEELKYVRATDADVTAWGSPLTVAAVDGSSDQSFASMAIVNGRPAIAFYIGFPDRDLNYVRATDSTGTSWTAPVIPDSTNNVGRLASLAVVDGHPAIAYTDHTNFDLKYVRADDAAGTMWATPITVRSDGDFAAAVSLAVVDGYPAIAYKPFADNLQFIRAEDAAGDSWSHPIEVGIGGRYASMSVVGGRPAIAYEDTTNDTLEFAIADR